MTEYDRYDETGDRSVRATGKRLPTTRQQTYYGWATSNGKRTLQRGRRLLHCVQTANTLQMRRDASTTVDNLDRPEGNSLQENYSLHDIAETHIKQHVRDLGLCVENWGIDMRNDDGSDGLVYDDKMDLKIVTMDDALVAITEVKTKSNDDWFGIINLRHYEHYLDIREEHDKPVYIYMALVNDSSDEDSLFDSDSGVIERDAFIPLDNVDADNPLDSPQVARSFNAPDGNTVVKLDEDSYVGWNEFAYDLGVSSGVIRE